MGYQESYVRMKNSNEFNILVDIIREIGKEYYEQSGTEPVKFITLNKKISGNLEHMCRPNEKYSFEPGEQFIYFVGERYLQRNANDLLNNKCIKGVEIYFTECFPSEQIFKENEGNKYALHEEFTWSKKYKSD